MHSRAKEKCLLDYPQFRPFSMAPLCWGRSWRKRRQGKPECEQGRETSGAARARRTGPRRWSILGQDAGEGLGELAKSFRFWKALSPCSHFLEEVSHGWSARHLAEKLGQPVERAGANVCLSYTQGASGLVGGGGRCQMDSLPEPSRVFPARPPLPLHPLP